MTSPGSLRSLGPDGLATLLGRRPELLDPWPPRTLAELAARLDHRGMALAALRRLDMPTLQIVQVLAALRERADRDRLWRLLGIVPGDPRIPTVERAIATLRADHLLADGGAGQDYRLIPAVRTMWQRPLGLSADVQTLAEQQTVEALRLAVNCLGRAAVGRKADLVRQVVALLGDGDRVRRLLDDVPPEFARQLRGMAHGRQAIDRHAWQSTSWRGLAGPRDADPQTHPLHWAMSRLLLVMDSYSYELVMPAEVALALRGPGWTALFTTDPPRLEWTVLAPSTIRDTALAAASTALRVLDAALSAAGRRPLPRLKAGTLGVRELRKLAQAVACTPGELRLTLSLAVRLGLLDTDADNGFAPTEAFDDWQILPATARFARLADAWTRLPDLPLLEPGTAWAPPRTDIDGADRVRLAVLTALGDRPDAAPASFPAFVARLRWQRPFLIGTVLHSSPAGPAPDPATDPAAGDGFAEVIETVQAEAAGLGLTGAGALAPAGAALATGGDVAASLADGLGAARTTARLQADLTAVVLGQPGPELATALEGLADRESGSTATVWRFSPASIRRALDAGDDADTVLARLADLADGEVPQPLAYLVRDVARRHGLARGRAVGCYLRSDDEALLGEIVADRTLRSLRLRRIAPTVVVGGEPWPSTLQALRAAGYAPVEENADGGTVVAVERRHRAVRHRPSRRARLAATGPEDGGAQPAIDDVVAALVAGGDDPGGPLFDVGSTVVEIHDSQDLVTARGY